MAIGVLAHWLTQKKKQRNSHKFSKTTFSHFDSPSFLCSLAVLNTTIKAIVMKNRDSEKALEVPVRRLRGNRMR